MKKYIGIKKRLSDVDEAYAAKKLEARNEEDHKKLLAVRKEMNTARLKNLQNAANVRKNPDAIQARYLFERDDSGYAEA